MSKRIMIGLFATIGLTALWWSDADAGCTSYKTIGGSSVCTSWSTKGVQVEVRFKQDCSSGEGGFGACNADATAQSSDNIAFCVDPAAPGGIRRVECSGARNFVEVVKTTCQEKHEEKDPFGPGVGHEHHGGCTQTLVLEAQCNDCCVGVGTGVCADVTPVEMDTQTIVENFNAGGDFILAQEASACDPTSPVCVINEHCSINPKKIAFIPPVDLESPDPLIPPGQKYQCNVTCVGPTCPCVGAFCLPPPCELC